MRAGTRAWTGTASGRVAAVAVAAFLVSLGSSPVCVEAQPTIPLNTYIWLQAANVSDTYIRHSSYVLYAAPRNGDDSIFKVVAGLQSGANGTVVSFQSTNFPAQ